MDNLRPVSLMVDHPRQPNGPYVSVLAPGCGVVVFYLGSGLEATPRSAKEEGAAATHTVFYLLPLIFALRYSRSQGVRSRGEDVSAEAAAWWDDLAVLRSVAARRPHRLPRL